MATETVELRLTAKFDSDRTNGESLAAALDRLLGVGVSLSSCMDRHRPLEPGAIEVSSSKVWVLLYHHRHGTDVSVHRSREAAREGVVDEMRIWLDETRDDERHAQIAELLRIRDVHLTESYKQLVRLWTDATEEGFEIDWRPIE